jgi:Tfp pilus assembly protein PilX
MTNTARQEGFILPVVVSCLLVVGIIAGGTIQYVLNGTRVTGVYATATQCRLSAQTALDIEKAEIFRDFKAYAKAYPSTWNLLGWFDTYGVQSVGAGSYASALMEAQTVNGCTVTVSLTDVERSTSAESQQYARLTLRATASCASPAGIPVEKIIEETVEYALRRSSVFDYAYFINNYGWFMGGGVTANGDIRANGNMYLDGQSWVNGFAFAAANSDLGAAGYIDGTARYKSIADYWAENNLRARPTSPTSLNGLTWAMGYEGLSELYSYQEPVEMPFLGDLDFYREVANNTGSSIKQNGKTIVDSCFSGTGPSGLADGADKGCLVLDGTSKPIEIDGPVVVDGDVIIKGTVKGQGAIYAGRNIYIVGNVSYSTSPSWAKPDTKPNQSVTQNAKSDMLGLAAKGNIVLGNYTDSTWLSTVKNYITPPFVKAYECDPTDASIGYGSVFNGDYTAKDSGKKVEYVQNSKTKEWEPKTTTDRRYYESTAGNRVISQLAQSSAITRVDAVLYNNHATMGKTGACQFNGALICRDEGIIYSSSVKFNWDIRLGSRSPDGIDFFIFLPMSPATPRVVGWQEVQ